MTTEQEIRIENYVRVVALRLDKTVVRNPDRTRLSYLAAEFGTTTKNFRRMLVGVYGYVYIRRHGGYGGEVAFVTSKIADGILALL